MEIRLERVDSPSAQKMQAEFKRVCSKRKANQNATAFYQKNGCRVMEKWL